MHKTLNVYLIQRKEKCSPCSPQDIKTYFDSLRSRDQHEAMYHLHRNNKQKYDNDDDNDDNKGDCMTVIAYDD